MIRWIFHIGFVVVLLAVVTAGGMMVRRERQCAWANRCEERLRGLTVQLEFFSVDKVLALEKQTGTTSERRAFYPRDLAELQDAKYLAPENARCPVYGVPYVYEPSPAGKSYLAYCPARHNFHFSGLAFCPAVAPDQKVLHLAVRGGSVVNLVGGHENPWDFKDGRFKEVPTEIAVSRLRMLATDPPPIVSF